MPDDSCFGISYAKRCVHFFFLLFYCGFFLSSLFLFKFIVVVFVFKYLLFIIVVFISFYFVFFLLIKFWFVCFWLIVLIFLHFLWMTDKPNQAKPSQSKLIHRHIHCQLFFILNFLNGLNNPSFIQPITVAWEERWRWCLRGLRIYEIFIMN